jgi:hypothetical protein
MKGLIIFGLGFLSAIPCLGASGSSFVPDRRREQFRNNPGYALLPYVYSLPGIGSGYGILGALTKVGGTYTDLTATAFGGGANGQAFGADGIHLISKTLILDFGGAHLSKTSVQSYSQRGMGSSKNDYSLAEFGDSLFLGSRMTATFFERRLEAFVGYYQGTARLNSLRDRSGNLLVDSSNSPKSRSDTEVLGLRFDLTDDYQDPRSGFRFEPSAWRSPPLDHGSDFLFTDLSATGYIPIGKRSVWAFNFLQSDAYVLRPGETNSAVLERQQGLSCETLTDAKARSDCSNYIANLSAGNAHGTATMLGGVSRLRAYPEGRYKGAHTRFIGTEYRWNITDQVRPFNIYVVKDIRTAVQAAFFYEAGTVADTYGGLWKVTRSAYGAGLRVVTASGLVYRLDMALGSEGAQPSVFFQYPWEL